MRKSSDQEQRTKRLLLTHSVCVAGSRFSQMAGLHQRPGIGQLGAEPAPGACQHDQGKEIENDRGSVQGTIIYWHDSGTVWAQTCRIVQTHALLLLGTNFQFLVRSILSPETGRSRLSMEHVHDAQRIKGQEASVPRCRESCSPHIHGDHVNRGFGSGTSRCRDWKKRRGRSESTGSGRSQGCLHHQFHGSVASLVVPEWDVLLRLPRIPLLYS